MELKSIKEVAYNGLFNRVYLIGNSRITIPLRHINHEEFKALVERIIFHSPSVEIDKNILETYDLGSRENEEEQT